MHKYLVKMFEEVVNPLKSEVIIKDEMIKRLEDEFEVLKKDVKILSSCIRLPAMCVQF